MFNSILVPLDGSRLAEGSLPAAVSLAQAFKSSVTLLHVIEQDAPAQIHKNRHLTKPTEAEAYLVDIAKRFFPVKARINTHVHVAPVNDVARSIVNHSADELHPDLIILTSHGNSGVHDLFFGNIAQQVVSIGVIPVLLIRPRKISVPFQINHILIPLDNESVHDKALKPAEALAKAYKAELDLLCVIPTPGTDSGAHAAAGTMLPTTAVAYLDLAEEIALEHFQAHLDEYLKNNISATAEIARGDPAPVIAMTAKKIDADLILFGTHGRSGLDAFWNRSVTAGVARRVEIPLMLIPLSET